MVADSEESVSLMQATRAVQFIVLGLVISLPITATVAFSMPYETEYTHVRGGTTDVPSSGTVVPYESLSNEEREVFDTALQSQHAEGVVTSAAYVNRGGTYYPVGTGTHTATPYDILLKMSVIGYNIALFGGVGFFSRVCARSNRVLRRYGTPYDAR